MTTDRDGNTEGGVKQDVVLSDVVKDVFQSFEMAS